jgi:hypothetical protein
MQPILSYGWLTFILGFLAKGWDDIGTDKVLSIEFSIGISCGKNLSLSFVSGCDDCKGDLPLGCLRCKVGEGMQILVENRKSGETLS